MFKKVAPDRCLFWQDPDGCDAMVGEIVGTEDYGSIVSIKFSDYCRVWISDLRGTPQGYVQGILLDAYESCGVAPSSLSPISQFMGLEPCWLYPLSYFSTLETYWRLAERKNVLARCAEAEKSAELLALAERFDLNGEPDGGTE